MEKKERLAKVYQILVGKGLVTTKKDMAGKLRIGYSTLSSAFGGNERMLTDNLFMRISRTFSGIFREQWLVDGEGDMLIDGTQEVPTINDNTDGDSTLVAILNERISMLQKENEWLRSMLDRYLTSLESCLKG